MSLSVNDVDFGEQNIIYVRSVPEKEKAAVEWTLNSTENLLKLLKKYIRYFETGKFRTKKELFENIAAAMEERGLFFSGPQCENKWKSLKRSFLNKYGRGSSSGSSKRYSSKSPHESQIEEILRIERPSFRKDLDMMSCVNLNVPPGFTRTKEEVMSESEEEMEPEYTTHDEELVKMVLRGNDVADEEDKNNMSVNNYEEPGSSHENEEHNYSHNEKRTFHETDELVKEVVDLKKIIKKNFDANTEVLRNHNATHEQILICLDALEKREEEKLDLKRRKLDKQGELVQQLKIQNSLVAKLIQKLGNK